MEQSHQIISTNSSQNKKRNAETCEYSLYLNAKKMAAAFSNASNVTFNLLRVGLGYLGWMDELAILNVSLSRFEIEYLFQTNDFRFYSFSFLKTIHFLFVHLILHFCVCF